MKQVIKDLISQKKTQEKKYKTLSIKHFYYLFFKKRSRKYQSVSLSLFKKIIRNYLSVYFHELYLESKPMYFFLGGKMKITLLASWKNYQVRGNNKVKEMHESEGAIGLFWYNKPSQRIQYMVKLKKLTGSTNMLPKIEALFNRNHNKDFLPIFTEEQRKGKKEKTLYKCIQI